MFRACREFQCERLLHGVADCLSDACVYGEIRILMDELFDTFRKRPDFCRRSLISLNLIRVLLLSGEQLSKAGEAISDFRIA